jgi:hypothetical protein
VSLSRRGLEFVEIFTAEKPVHFIVSIKDMPTKIIPDILSIRKPGRQES